MTVGAWVGTCSIKKVEDLTMHGLGDYSKEIDIQSNLKIY